MTKFARLFKRGDTGPQPTPELNNARPQMWAPQAPAPAAAAAAAAAPFDRPPQPAAGNPKPRFRFKLPDRGNNQPKDAPRAQHSQQQGKAVTPEDLYSLRELMRAKYTRDVEVYSMRKAYRANLPIREEAQRKADQTMQEILRRVAEWDADRSWDPEEMELVRDVQRRLGLLTSPGPESSVDGAGSTSDFSSRFEHVSVSDAR